MARSEYQRIKHLTVLLAACGLLLWLHVARPAVWAQQDETTPTPDPLAIPELPENPTQVDLGRVSYYYNCMPCHGDQGQGLTDEWRATWVDDHQNCWARGCHSNRLEEEGFPIPTVVPPVAGTVYTLIDFSTPDSLYDYLQSTHPPQNPGILTEEDYWALTAFLLSENDRLPDGRELGESPPIPSFDYRLALILVLALVSGIFILTRYRRKSLS
jgi:mono/diheme cytochrome c family protein